MCCWPRTVEDASRGRPVGRLAELEDKKEPKLSFRLSCFNVLRQPFSDASRGAHPDNDDPNHARSSDGTYAHTSPGHNTDRSRGKPRAVLRLRQVRNNRRAAGNKPEEPLRKQAAPAGR